MPRTVARKAVDLALAQPGSELNLGFFGGEPLLQFALIQEVVTHAGQAANEHGKQVHFAVVTNGTLVTEKTADYLAENHFLAILSLDGDRRMHDKARLHAGGQSSFDEVIRALHFFQERALRLKVICVLSPQNLDAATGAVQYLTQDLGITDLYLSIDYLSSWTTADQGRLCDVLESYADDVIAGYRAGHEVAVNLFDDKIRTHIKQGYGKCRLCPFGDGGIAVDVTGDIYPCDRVAQDGGNPKLIVGHVDTGIDHQRVRQLAGCLSTPAPTCEACEFRPRCRSWCGCATFESSGTVGGISPFFCAMEKHQIRCADRIAETLFQEGNIPFIRKFYGHLINNEADVGRMGEKDRPDDRYANEEARR